MCVCVCVCVSVCVVVCSSVVLCECREHLGHMSAPLPPPSLSLLPSHPSRFLQSLPQLNPAGSHRGEKTEEKKRESERATGREKEGRGKLRYGDRGGEVRGRGG